MTDRELILLKIKQSMNDYKNILRIGCPEVVKIYFDRMEVHCRELEKYDKENN